jgi:arginine decarboxylase
MTIKNKSITHILNHITPKSIRWCTPSIELNLERVKDHHLSDMSVSFQKLGFPSEPSGMFLHAYHKAAKAYGSDKTLFSVNGSTGSNYIVLRTLSKQIPNLRILAQRNIHKSVLNACQDFGINLLFVEPHIDPHLQIFIPNSIKDFTQAIQKTKPHVLLITNPTYEGLTIDLKNLILKARKINPNIIIFVEEAWGSHLAFSNKLPISAMQSGADICVQSTHKQGGSLQQTSMIHWMEKRIKSHLLLESYRSLSTSSPSYILMASLDAAREQMEKYGEKRIERSLKIAKKLEKGLETVPGFHVVKLYQLRKKFSAVNNKDNTKVLVDVSKSGYTGFKIANFLEEKYNIIVEKYNATTLLFLIPFQSKIENIKITIDALKDFLVVYKELKNGIDIPLLEIPQNIPRILELGDVAKLYQNQIECIPLKDAKGRISAENIIPYPPGIPITTQGEEFTSKAITFYQAMTAYPNSHILAHDLSLNTVLVVK